MAHQFWFSYPPPSTATGRSQADDEKKEKKEIADVVARAEQQQQKHQLIQQRVELDRDVPREYRLERHVTLCPLPPPASSSPSLVSDVTRPELFSSSQRNRYPLGSDDPSLENAPCDCCVADCTTQGRLTAGFGAKKNSVINGEGNQSMNMQFLPPQKSSSTSFNRHSSITSSGLRYRNLGKSGLRVSNIGFGTWSTFSDEVVGDQAEDIIGAAYESGINLFDLSEAHSGEMCELELGKILNKKMWKRSSYVIVIKIYWHSRSEERGLSRKHIISSVRTSLARLQLDYVDVVIVHKADPMCPIEEVVRAINHVIDAGWAMYWGTARWTPYEIMEAYTNCRQFNCVTPIVEQAEYHMFCREKAELYMPETYNKIGVGLMVWSPISMGMISSELPFIKAPSLKNKCISFTWSDDETRFGTTDIISWWLKDRSQSEESERQLERLRSIAEIAEKLECSLTQLCIAWCLKNESVHCLLVGATSVRQFYHILQSIKLVSKLNANIMAEVEHTLDNKPLRPPIISTLALR